MKSFQFLPIGLFYVISLFGLTSSFFSKAPEAGTLVVHVHEVKPSKGFVHVSLYNSQSTFLEKNGEFQKTRRKVGAENMVEISFKNVPYGTYAAAAYYDENGNNKLDKTFIGFPSEPYAFSQTYHAKTRKPYFNEVHFTFERSGQLLKMNF